MDDHSPSEILYLAAILAEDADAITRHSTAIDAEDDARRARLTAPGALASSALWYASIGVPVFPIQPGGKRPYPGSHGCKDATTDPAQVTAWWTANPDANIGIATGHGLDVIDIDGPPGYLSLADLRERGLIPPVLARAGTPRGGAHLYIASTGDGNTAGLLPGIDVRGVGGYVVAPPSLGPNGRHYAWTTPLDPAVLTSQAAA